MNYDGARVRAGDLRQSLAFYSPSLVVDSYGQREDNWNFMLDVWVPPPASVDPSVLNKNVVRFQRQP